MWQEMPGEMVNCMFCNSRWESWHPTLNTRLTRWSEKYTKLDEQEMLKKRNKTEILSDDALVWTAVFIDWLDGVELFRWSFELLGMIEYLTIESFMRYMI